MKKESKVFAERIKVKILLENGAVMPEKKSNEAACYDLHTIQEVVLYPGETRLIKTGVKVEIPAGYHIAIMIRSGFAAKGILLANGVGIIDSDYRGEIHVPLFNSSAAPFKISFGERAAQMRIVNNTDIEFIEIDSISELSATERGDGGFGSTGAK